MSTQAKNKTYGACADAPTTASSDEERQLSRLHKMQDRLSALSEVARAIRSQLPREFEPDVELLQQQMDFLGDRLAELSVGSAAIHAAEGTTGEKTSSYDPMTEAQSSISSSQSENVIQPGGSAADPWDEESADALARLYELGEATFGTAEPVSEAEAPQPAAAVEAPSPSKAPPEQQSGTFAIEPAWLEERFAEIAHRIEQSLAEIRPESSLLTFGRRFDQLEERVSSALDGIATRADVQELRLAEAQIEEISAQLDHLRGQLARLDRIDTHLGTLTAQLSDERMTELLSRVVTSSGEGAHFDTIDAKLGSLAAQLSDERMSELLSRGPTPVADLKSLATAAAQETAASFANNERSEAHTRDLGEVRTAVENLINERRHNDENNASMLETMQQAIIRVLDRIDALELATHKEDAPSAEPLPTEEMKQPEVEPLHAQSFSGTDQYDSLAFAPPAAPEESTYEAPRYMTAPFQPAPFETAPSQATPFETQVVFGSESDIETGTDYPDAATPSLGSIDTLRRDLIADAHRAKLKAATQLDASAAKGDAQAGQDAGVKVKKPVAGKAGRLSSRVAMPKRRLLVSAVALLLIIPAVVLLISRISSDSAAVPASEAALPGFLEGISVQGDRATPGPASNTVPGGGDGAQTRDSAIPGRPSRQSGPQPQPSSQEFEDVGKPAQPLALGRVDTAAVLHGIPLVLGKVPLSEQFAQDDEPQNMAYLSQLGEPAARATHAALRQEQDPQQSGIQPSAGGDASKDGVRTVRLPPATVGLYSLRVAAAQGDPSAQFEVGARLARGEGGLQDLEEAARWYQRSATSGFAMAQYRLGTLYERGLGVTTDLGRAQAWYRRAAEQGNRKAMHNLAVLSAGRDGHSPDYPTAAQWFLEAAERGLPDSQYNMAILYENGFGVSKDVKQAYKWLLLAAKSGDKESTRRRDAIKAKLSAEDRAAARLLARDWKAKPSDPTINDARLAGQAWQRGPQNATSG